MKIYDVAIIGQGPAGITAALYLARSGCSVVIFERLTPGGQILSTESLENYPGFPSGIKGYELADLYEKHIGNYDVDRVTGEISSITSEAGVFLINLGIGGKKYTSKTVIVSSGARHRPLGLPKEKELIGNGISYCALCDGNFYRDLTVAVVGGGNAALEESLYLARIVEKVHLIHRRDSFRGSKIYQDKLKAMPDKIKIHFDTIITDLAGTDSLEGLVLKNVKSGESHILPIAALFVYIGFLPHTAFLPEEIQKDERGFIITDTEMRTNIPGIFAAGDVRSKQCRQVITAAGDGATAAQAAFLYLEKINA